jgi:hypothetical protein
MRYLLSVSALGLCCAAAVPARADNVSFICRSEEAANAIGEALAEGQEKGREVAYPLLQMGVCEYLDEKIFVYIVHRGGTYGSTNRLTVVGLSPKMGEFPDMWGLKPTDELPGDDTI